MKRGDNLDKKYVTFLFIFLLLVITFILLFFLESKFTGMAVFTPGPGADQTTLTLQDADIDNLGDVYVGGDSPNTNFNDRDYLLVKWGTPKRNTYLNFNISLIPNNQIIDDAKICLYLYNDQGTQTIRAHHVYFDFNESVLTWNNQACGINFDNSVNCNLTAESTLTPDGTESNTWQCWNVTNMLSNQYNGSENNISIVLHTEDTGNADYFYSKEYITDTSLIPYLNITYHAANTAPVLDLIEPQNQLYTENESLALNYTVFDEDANLNSCWYNIDAGTNITLLGCVNTTFDVSEGNHNLTIYANDSFELISKNSVEFNVDASGISLLISEPTDTKTSRTSIPLTYTVIGTDVLCWYNVKTSVGGNIIGNTTLINCSSSSFDVSTDGDYVLNLYANNTLGTFTSEVSSFSVDTSDPVIISGGGGGGGGGTTVITGLTELEIENLPDLVVYPGDNKKLSWRVKNTGTSILNDCNLVEKGDANFWILPNEFKNLASGEIYDFVFNLGISESVNPGKYNLEVSLQCQEINKSTSIVIEIIERKLGFEIWNVERLNDEQVKVSYLLQELSNIEQEVKMQFLLFDSENKKIAEVEETKTISANSKDEFDILIPVDASLIGEMNLLVNLNSETYSTFIQEEIILGAPISGLSVFGDEGTADKAISIFLIILFLVGAFFIIRKTIQHRKKVTKKKKRVRKKKFDFKPF
jgi:hypothetical protein